MTNEVEIRAYKALITQAKYDMAEVRAKYKAYRADPEHQVKIVPPFSVAYVIGDRIFLTEDAATGWPIRHDQLLEHVFIEDAFKYADKNPDFLEAIHSMFLSDYMKKKESEQDEAEEQEQAETEA